MVTTSWFNSIETNSQRNKMQSSADKNNLSLINKWLNKSSFWNFLESFVDTKSDSINKLSCNMSENNVEMDTIWALSIDTSNIKKYDQRDNLNYKTQYIISNIFLNKILEKWKSDPNFRSVFDYMFKDFDNKNISFHHIQSNIDELLQEFPDIINNISVSNYEIFQWLNNKYGSNINILTNFNWQNISDKNILCELIYLETKDAVKKIQSTNKKVGNDAVSLIKQPISTKWSIDDFLSEIENKNILWKKKNWNKINPWLKKIREINEKNYYEKIEIQKKIEKEFSKDKTIENTNTINNLNKNIESIDKKIWKWYIEQFKWLDCADDKNKKFLDILTKLVDNNFDYSDLSEEEQKLYMDKTLEKNIDSLAENEWIHGFWLDTKEYKKFLKKLLSFEKKDENISIKLPDWNDIKLKIKKRFKQWENLDLLNYKNFESSTELPIIFDISLDWCDAETINILEDDENAILSNKINWENIISNYKTKNGIIRVWNNYNLNIEGVDVNAKVLNKIAINNDEEGLRAGFKEYGLWNEKISKIFDKELIKVNEKISDNKVKKHEKIDELFEWICENLDIKVKSRNLELKWSNINKINQMYIFAMAKSNEHKNIENNLKWKNSVQEPVNNLLNTLSDTAIDDDKAEKTEQKEKNNFDLKLTELIKTDNNINIGIPTDEEILSNANLNDQDRLKKAEEILRKIAQTNNLDLQWFNEKIKNGLLNLVLFAHESTVINKDEYDVLDKQKQNNYIKAGDKYYEFGDDWLRPAWIYNNTKKQLKEKIKILQDGIWFESRQIKALLRYGICWIDPDKIAKQAWEDSANEIFEEIIIAQDYDEDAFEEAIEISQDNAQKKFDRLDNVWKKVFKNRLEELANNDNEETQHITQEIVANLEDKNTLDSSSLSKKELADLKEKEKQQELEDRKMAEAKEDSPEKKFNKLRERLSWNNNCKFEKWTRLFINIGGSVLPPQDKSASFFELEIININDTKFQIKVIGNEIKNDMDGQKMRFPKTDKQLIEMQKSGEIFKVAKWNPKNWDACIDNINKSKITSKTNVFGSGDGEVHMENGKFVNNEWEEINYFCRSDDTYSWELDETWKAIWQTKNYINYKIKKINKSKWTVHVLCNFEWQDPDNLAENINYKYDKELSYEQFILLMESKSTRGYTKEQKDNIFGVNWPDRLPNKWLFRFRSISAIVWSFKNGVKTIKEKLWWVNEEEVSDIENLLYSEEWFNLYGKLWNMFWAIWFTWTSDAFDTAKIEFYGDRESRTWKKIEKRYNHFDKDPHFPTLYYEQLQQLLETPGYVGDKKNRYKVAAAFLILMKKDGPYGRWTLLQHIWKWYWIEKFLGTTHRDRFKKMFKQRKKQLEENIDWNPHQRKRWQEELNRLEFDYITGVVDGRQPFGWFPNDGEHAWASMWSRNFATTLDENQKTYFTWFDEKAKKLSNMSFKQAEQEYFRMVTTWRFHKALPFLNRMAEDAQDKNAESRVKMCITWAILSWLFKNAQDSSVMTKFWAISRTMWFLPWIWSRDTNQQDKMLKLLDWITATPPFKLFSEDTWYKKSDFEPGSWNKEQLKLKFLSQDLPQYWTKYGDKLLDILEFRNMNPESNNIINLAEKWWDTWEVCQEILEFSREKTDEDTDKDVSYVYGYNTNSPWTTNKSMVWNKVPREGKYPWNEKIEVEAAEEFWTSVSSSFDTWKQAKAGNVEFYLWKYRNWFDSALDQTNIKIMMRWLPLVQKLKNEWHTQEARYQLWYLTKWILHSKLWSMPTEFGTAIDKFEEFFWNNIDYFNSNMIKNIFWEESADDFEDPYGMLAWDEFYDKFMLFDGQTGGWPNKTKYVRKYKQGKYREENYLNRWISAIRKKIKWKWTEPNIPTSNIAIDYWALSTHVVQKDILE